MQIDWYRGVYHPARIRETRWRLFCTVVRRADRQKHLPFCLSGKSPLDCAIGLSSPFRKNISLNLSGKSKLELVHPVLREGRFAIVMKRGMGCDGRDSVGAQMESQGRFIL